MGWEGGRWGEGEGRGHMPPPKKKFRKNFLGNYYVKFGHFSDKSHVKFSNFVNFLGKYHKNLGILQFFGHESCTIRAFC